MSKSSCAHLHVHSEYSLLDGACKIEALAERAAQFEQPALGLTDHGVMNGAVELHKACAKHGVKPIVGCEIYLVNDHTAPTVGGEGEQSATTSRCLPPTTLATATSSSSPLRVSWKACSGASRRWTSSRSHATPRA